MNSPKEFAKQLPYPVLLRLFLMRYRRVELRKYEEARRRLRLPLLAEIDITRHKGSDTLVILGSGPSINRISAERWEAIARHDTAAMNFWVFHPFIPKFYFYEEVDKSEKGAIFEALSEATRLRAGDYKRTIKIVTELQHGRGEMTASMPESWRENLFTVYPMQFPARSVNEFDQALAYFARKGTWREGTNIRSAVKYSSTLSLLLSFAAILRYRRVVLCGVDLTTSAYFYQDPELYPQTSALEFVNRKEQHPTFRQLPWLVPMDAVIDCMRARVLDPLGMEIFLESDSSALASRFPTISTEALAAEKAGWRDRTAAPAKKGISGLLSRALKTEEWFLAVSRRDAPGSLAPDPKETTLIEPEPGAFYADPHILSVKGTEHIFFEHYHHRDRKGTISFCSWDGERWSRPQSALVRDYHLSYPFVFEHDGEIFMVPETSRNFTIELYRAVNFPSEWKLEKTLMTRVNASDTTLLFRGGRIWMFTSIAESREPALGRLYVFHSESLTGEWRPHDRNPVVRDPLRSRPAGGFMEEDGALIRPSQDCWHTYGEAIILNRVDKLSESSYSEAEVGSLQPNWMPGISRTHTISRTKNFQVVDAMRYTRRRDIVSAALRRARGKQ